MFPASIEGSVGITSHTASDVEAITRRLRDDLTSQGVFGQVNGNTVSFVNDRNATFQRFFFKRFQIVDSGEFVISGGNLHYRLSTALLLLPYSTMMLVPLAFCLATQRFISAIGVVALWTLVACGSYSLAAYRNLRTLKRIVA